MRRGVVGERKESVNFHLISSREDNYLVLQNVFSHSYEEKSLASKQFEKCFCACAVK